MNPKVSPCIGICKLDTKQVCIGCNRHINEIIHMGNKNKECSEINQLEADLLKAIEVADAFRCFREGSTQEKERS